MLLVKCECGCWYTLDEKKLADTSDKPRTCPNCFTSHNLEEIFAINGMCSDYKFNVQRIPNNSKINVTFDLERQDGDFKTEINADFL